LAVYRSLFNSLNTVRLNWTAQTDAVGYNVYRTNTPHLCYVRINTTLVTGTSFSDTNVGSAPTYIYAVTAVGPTGLESNRSSDSQWMMYLDGLATAPASIRAPSAVPSFGFPVLRGIR